MYMCHGEDKEGVRQRKGMEEAEIKKGSCRRKDVVDAIVVVKRSCAPALRRSGESLCLSEYGALLNSSCISGASRAECSCTPRLLSVRLHSKTL